MRPMYYDRQGRPITLAEWSDLLGTPGYKIVCQDTIGRYFVSTVWLGLDHSFLDEVPMIFETMIFPVDSYEDLACRRYYSDAQARRGHQVACRLARLWESVAREDELATRSRGLDGDELSHD